VKCSRGLTTREFGWELFGERSRREDCERSCMRAAGRSRDPNKARSPRDLTKRSQLVLPALAPGGYGPSFLAPWRLPASLYAADVATCRSARPSRVSAARYIGEAVDTSSRCLRWPPLSAALPSSSLSRNMGRIRGYARHCLTFIPVWPVSCA
jgi:hypothetical protein